MLSGIPKQESILIGSDMNGHVGRDADGYGGVHGGMGFGTRNTEGERKTDRCLVKDVKVISSEVCPSASNGYW